MLENKERKSCYYEVYLKSFLDSNGDGVGDIRGFRSKLSLIGQLGVNYCLLDEIFFGDNENLDYFKIDPDLGGMDDLKELCEKAKTYRMKIILDLDLESLIKNENIGDLEAFIKEIILYYKDQGVKGFRFLGLDRFLEKDNSEKILANINEYTKDLGLLLIGSIENLDLIKKEGLVDMVYYQGANDLIEKNSYENFYKLLDRLQEESLKEEIYYGIDFSNLKSPRLMDKLLKDDEESKALSLGLAYLIFSLGTVPFIYMGTEVEAKAEYSLDIGKLNDPEIKSLYKDLVESGKSEDEAKEYIKKKSPLSARLPLRWDGSSLGGFSESKNYYGAMVNLDNNYKAYLKDKDSFFFLLYKIIMLRKRYSAFGLGDYEKLILDESVYAYKRSYKDDSFVVLVNLTDDFYLIDEEVSAMIGEGEVIFNNNKDFEAEILDAYQALIIKI